MSSGNGMVTGSAAAWDSKTRRDNDLMFEVGRRNDDLNFDPEYFADAVMRSLDVDSPLVMALYAKRCGHPEADSLLSAALDHTLRRAVAFDCDCAPEDFSLERPERTPLKLAFVIKDLKDGLRLNGPQHISSFSDPIVERLTSNRDQGDEQPAEKIQIGHPETT